MTRIILAVAAAFALVSAAPAFACPDCKDCPMHKDKVAAVAKWSGGKPEMTGAVASRLIVTDCEVSRPRAPKTIR